MNEKELDAVLLKKGFYSIEHFEDEDESEYYIKAWFKYRDSQSFVIKEGKFQLVARKDEPEKILNQAQTAIDYCASADGFEFIDIKV